MKLLERINQIFKTNEEAMDFFLENTETLFICKLCKSRQIIKKRKIGAQYCCYVYSEFQNTHVFFRGAKIVSFRRNLALLYYLYHLSIVYKEDFQKKFTRNRVSKHVVMFFLYKRFDKVRKNFQVIKKEGFRKYSVVFAKITQMLKQY
jgi:hypothetical protein